jgi:hypothetical protein
MLEKTFVQLVAACREDNDHHDRNEDEDKSVLHHPCPLSSEPSRICSSRVNANPPQRIAWDCMASPEQ